MDLARASLLAGSTMGPPGRISCPRTPCRAASGRAARAVAAGPRQGLDLDRRRLVPVQDVQLGAVAAAPIPALQGRHPSPSPSPSPCRRTRPCPMTRAARSPHPPPAALAAPGVADRRDGRRGTGRQPGSARRQRRGPAEGAASASPCPSSAPAAGSHKPVMVPPIDAAHASPDTTRTGGSPRDHGLSLPMPDHFAF